MTEINKEFIANCTRIDHQLFGLIINILLDFKITTDFICNNDKVWILSRSTHSVFSRALLQSGYAVTISNNQIAINISKYHDFIDYTSTIQQEEIASRIITAIKKIYPFEDLFLHCSSNQYHEQHNANFMANYLNQVDPSQIITAIDASIRFPEILEISRSKYCEDIATFKEIVHSAASTNELLEIIRSEQFNAKERMSLLKIFRRSVSPVLDTEMAKKTRNISTSKIIETVGWTFKSIDILKEQFGNLTTEQEAALAALIGEYDTRGALGYVLTDKFFSWFEQYFSVDFTIQGPRGAGKDVELSTVFQDYPDKYPCDFIIRNKNDNEVKAIGFARYDSTRGGAQSDDRTGGNSDKVSKASSFCERTGHRFKIIFLSDGPGLMHRDTWEEACKLDGSWSGNVRVTTLKTAPLRVTADWLMST